MKKKIRFAICGLAMLGSLTSEAQYLDHVAPVNIGRDNLTPGDNTSFILSAVDYKFYIGQPTPYSNTIQIVDAAKPWPPRWFASTPLAVNEYPTGGEATALIDASVQNGKLSFFSLIDTRDDKGDLGRKQSYLFCNDKMMITDTFTTVERAIDGHDFKASADGEKLYFLPKQSTVDMSSITHDAQDKALQVFYEEIQIADKKGNVIFRWDPIQKLGLDATYLPYRYVEAVISNRDQYGWGHGNSLSWDEDGNILYSFKNIGIGKISRADGHIIWRIDRSKLKINQQSDELPIYLQHSFQWVKDADGGEHYTILSNGDSTHPHCFAYDFAVRIQDGNTIVKVLRKIKAAEDLPNTLGGGNYDEMANGNYVFNYGAYWAKDSTIGRPVFEYGDKKHLLSQYTVPYTVICFKAHTYDNPRPPRPEIKAAGSVLTATGLRNYKWYQLSGKDLNTVKEVGSGPTYKATEKGTYCVTAKYGIGCSVSEPYEVK
jgi:hypothetical protein